MERSRLEIPEVLKKRWSRSPVMGVKKFEPKLTILDDESLLPDRPLEGGNLGYRILKATQLKYDMSVDEVQALAAVHVHNLALVSPISLLSFHFQVSYRLVIALRLFLVCFSFSSIRQEIV